MMTSKQRRPKSRVRGTFERLEPRTLLAAIPIFATGVDGRGAVLAANSTDSHFSIISSPVGARTPTVLTQLPVVYVANSTTSQWIGPQNVGTTGDFTYQETFDLTGLVPSTAVIHGQIASDDDSRVILNGVDTGVAVTRGTGAVNYDWGSLHAFTLTKGFVAGLNTLQVVVHNDYSSTGLRMDLSGTATLGPPRTVSGTVYLDLNADGSQEAGEPGLAGRVVYLDANHDGTFDPGDPTATTDPAGHFSVSGSVVGALSVLEATGSDASARYTVDQAATNADGTVSIGVVPISPVAPVPVVPNPFAGVGGSGANTAYVQSLYRAILGRVGDTAGVNGWLAKLAAGANYATVAQGLINSAEHRQDEVRAYYLDFLHRAPDASSSYFVNQLVSGASEESVAEEILDSPEYQSAHRGATQLVQALYTDILGRVGDAAGVAAFVSALGSGATPAQVVAALVQSTEAVDQVVDGFYSAYLHRPNTPVSASAFWTTMLEAPGGSASAVAVGILTSAEYIRDATTSGG